MQRRTTDVFAHWLERLRDPKGKAAVLRRIARMEKGNPGDTKSVGGGVKEMRIPTTGAGYRVYYVERGSTVIILLCAGDKSSQSRDIERAHELANEV